VNGVMQLLPLMRGDVRLLRTALSAIRGTAGLKDEAIDSLLRRLESGLIDRDELELVRRLVETEHMLRSLVIRQHAPGPDPDPDGTAPEALQALKDKLATGAPLAG
jgi:hypothetical protein